MPQVVRNRLALLPVSLPSNEEVGQTTDTMSADGTLGERCFVFNAHSWAAVAAGIFPNKEYDWALNLRKQLGARLTAKERLDASILGLKWLMETFPEKYHPLPTSSHWVPTTRASTSPAPAGNALRTPHIEKQAP